MQLLERERELAELREAVRDAQTGRGRLVVIEAQAGLGKTRLLQAARETAAAADLRVLSSRATELERDFPFALARQLLDGVLAAASAADRAALFEGAAGAARGALGLAPAAWTGDGGPRTDAFAVLNGLYWLVAGLAERSPLALIVDDAHWADAASLDFLGFLLPRLEELPVAVILAARPGNGDTVLGLARITADATATRLTLATLSGAATGALLAAELGDPPAAAFVAVCHDVTGGNPFFLREVARSLAARGITPGAEYSELVRDLAPKRVTRTIQLRVAQLSRESRMLARALAVLGDDADDALVASLAGLDLDVALHAADELRAAAIFDAAATLRFIHPLVRTALHTELAAGERASAHSRAAELLRARDAAPEQVATHLLATAPRGDRATVEILLDAGERALVTGAPRSAIAYLTRAHREPPPTELRAAVLGPLITASVRAGGHRDYAALEPAVTAAIERDPDLRSRWTSKVAIWMALNGRLDRGLGLLDEAIGDAADEGDAARAFRFEAQRCMISQMPPAQMRERLVRYRGAIAPGGDGEQLALAFEAFWCVLDSTAAEAMAIARQILARGGLFAVRRDAIVPAHVVTVLLLADELELADGVVEEALAVAVDRGAATELIGSRLLRGLTSSVRGDLVAAETDFRQGRDVAREAGWAMALPVFAALLMIVLIERGEPDGAAAELEASGMAGPIPNLLWLAPILYARGMLRLAQGRYEDAATDLLELSARREGWGLHASPAMPADLYAARALAALGDRERARALAVRELAQARRWGGRSVISNALRTLGVIEGGDGGIALLEESVRVLGESSARLARAHALGELGAALRRSNRRAQAREPLREALDLARRCGANGLAKRTADELLASGETVRRWTPIGVESLTPSERRAAELAASELTNRQIAQQLFVTVKTVETHLAAAYDKLGIRSRRQLAAALRAADRP